MTSRTETTDALTGCYHDLGALIQSLTSDQWAVQSLCPDWTVRGVVSHLAGVEHALTGWRPQPDDDKPPFAKVGPFMSEVAGLRDDDFTARVAGVLADRRRDLAAATDDDFARASMTPVGPGTYHRFMNVRIFDFWVHQRDMTVPLGLTTDDAGPAAEITVDEVHGSLGYITGKKIGLPDGMSLAVHLTGPVTRDLYVAVDGRAAVVDELASPSVELTTDSLTFVLLACGRIDPQGAIDDGRITWSGDAEWGERAARNLAFTM